MKSYILNTSQKIPVIGFGTWEVTPDLVAKEIVGSALELGYRNIDTARIYENERGVGLAIAASHIDRNKLFIASKLWNDDQGYDRTIRACSGALVRLGLDYLDLYLIHWPATTKRIESWRAFEVLLKDGLIQAAGVSNFTVRHLEELCSHSQLVPAVNQIEFHPFIYKQQQRVLNYCQERGIVVEAYCPVHRLVNEQHSIINRIALRYKKSPQQILLRWCLQHGTVPLARSTNRYHIASNLDVFNFELDTSTMEHLNSLSDGVRVTWDPSNMR